MKSQELDQLIETARRRVLSAEELRQLDALLEAAPTVWPERNDELALTRMLAALPDAPVASNFSTRVMQAIDRIEAPAAPAIRRAGWGPRHWFGRLAWATVAVAVTGGSWLQYESWQRTETARSLQVITEVAAVPSVDILKDFDVIQSFASVPPAADVVGDLELLNALQ